MKSMAEVRSGWHWRRVKLTHILLVFTAHTHSYCTRQKLRELDLISDLDEVSEDSGLIVLAFCVTDD